MYTPFRRVKLLDTKKRNLSSVLSRIPSIHLPFITCLRFLLAWNHRSAQCSCPTFCFVQSLSSQRACACAWILPIPIQPFGDPGSSRISKLRLPPGAFLPSFLSIFSSYLPLLRSFFFFFFSIRASIKETRLDWKIEARLENRGSIGKQGVQLPGPSRPKASRTSPNFFRIQTSLTSQLGVR